MSAIGAANLGATHDADIVVVGGGLAGASLACHLVRRGLGGRRLLVLEARQAYRHDRHWCSWSPPTHPFVDCIERTWTRWRVAADGRAHVQECAEQPYSCIPSGRLYQEVERQLRAAANAELRMATPVRAVRDRGGHAEVELEDGAVLRAGLVFDSRPGANGVARAAADRREVAWVQDFLGWRVHSERPVFDPATVDLMEFHEGAGDVRFVYVLPFSPREALVEATAFAPSPVPDAEHERVLREHLDGPLGRGGYRILHTERGAVPMTTRRVPAPRPGARVVPIGIAGGFVKPSTGYSFEAVQRWSAAIAEDLAAGRAPAWRAPRPRRALAMDRMFLAFLRRRPRQMPALFLRMFEKVPPASLVRFLSDRGSLFDAAAVAMALPKLPMLGEAVRSLRLWARSA